MLLQLFNHFFVRTCAGGLSSKHRNSCQKERLSFRFRVSMAGRSAANRSGLLKNGWRNCLYGAFLRPGGCFFAVKTESFSAKKRTAFRKGETFLPQGSSCGCGMKGKTGPRKAFPVLDGVRLRANSVCPFASHSPCRGDEEGWFRPHGVPWWAAKCRRNRLSAFILHALGRARFAYFRSISAPSPFARFSQGLS